MDDLPEQAEPEQVEPERSRVGYCQPPLHSRFRKGQSGNPPGRPKGKRSVEAMVNEVLAEKIWATTQGKRKRVPVELGILYRIREMALKGDLRAARLLLDLKRGTSGSVEPEASGDVLSQEDRAILANAGLLPTSEEQADGGA